VSGFQIGFRLTGENQVENVIIVVCGLIHVLLQAKGLNKSQKMIGIRVGDRSVDMKIKVSGDQ
jgi:hypothetical protein